MRHSHDVRPERLPRPDRRRPLPGSPPCVPDLDTFLSRPAARANLEAIARFVGPAEARRLAARILAEMDPEPKGDGA